MLRIANPGSDIDQFIRISQDLYVVLKDRADFDPDDMSVAMVEWGNVSSQGAFGEEALPDSSPTNAHSRFPRRTLPIRPRSPCTRC